jgi:hypothetical protein
MSNNDLLLSPFTLPNGTVLKNRILMAPMTTCTGFYDGTVTSELVEYYRARAGSIGTVIVECCFVDDRGLAFPGAIGIDNDAKIDGLAKIAAAVKSQGSKAVLQIYHGGRMSEPKLIGGQQPVAPSALAAPREGAATPVALTAEEVDGMIAKFGEGVRRAIEAGFDGVEIPTSVTTNGAAAVKIAPVSRWRCWTLLMRWRRNTPTTLSLLVIVSPRKNWKNRVSVLPTPCTCWNNWRRAVWITCISPSVTRCVLPLLIPRIRRR